MAPSERWGVVGDLDVESEFRASVGDHVADEAPPVDGKGVELGVGHVPRRPKGRGDHLVEGVIKNDAERAGGGVVRADGDEPLDGAVAAVPDGEAGEGLARDIGPRELPEDREERVEHVLGAKVEQFHGGW